MNRLAVPIGRLASRKRAVMMGAMTARTSTASKTPGDLPGEAREAHRARPAAGSMTRRL
jgi:hypothetical protein